MKIGEITIAHKDKTFAFAFNFNSERIRKGFPNPPGDRDEYSVFEELPSILLSGLHAAGDLTQDSDSVIELISDLPQEKLRDIYESYEKAMGFMLKSIMTISPPSVRSEGLTEN